MHLKKETEKEKYGVKEVDTLSVCSVNLLAYGSAIQVLGLCLCVQRQSLSKVVTASGSELDFKSCCTNSCILLSVTDGVIWNKTKA